jgi:tetratricopeptide (TPR) repeat protein
MKRVVGVALFFYAFSSYSIAQESSPAKIDSVAKGQLNSHATPSKESGTSSAPASVKLNTPTLNMDVLLDLYNKDIDFTIDYSGKGLKQNGQTSNDEEQQPKRTANQKKRAAGATDELLKPQEEDLSSDIQDIVDTSKVKKKQPRQGTFTKDDADYNKALDNLQEAQNLFSERRYLQALSEINKSVETAPNMALAYAVRGSIYYMLRQFPEAKLSWEKALELDPSMDNVRAILYRM